MIGELWHLVQTTPGYKNNTNFLITTDHGRGNTSKHRTGHGFFINGSSETWIGLLGPGTKGAEKDLRSTQLYNKQIAGTIANLIGEEFR